MPSPVQLEKAIAIVKPSKQTESARNLKFVAKKCASAGPPFERALKKATDKPVDKTQQGKSNTPVRPSAKKAKPAKAKAEENEPSQQDELPETGRPANVEAQPVSSATETEPSLESNPSQIKDEADAADDQAIDVTASAAHDVVAAEILAAQAAQPQPAEQSRQIDDSKSADTQQVIEGKIISAKNSTDSSPAARPVLAKPVPSESNSSKHSKSEPADSSMQASVEKTLAGVIEPESSEPLPPATSQTATDPISKAAPKLPGFLAETVSPFGPVDPGASHQQAPQSNVEGQSDQSGAFQLPDFSLDTPDVSNDLSKPAAPVGKSFASVFGATDLLSSDAGKALNGTSHIAAAHPAQPSLLPEQQFAVDNHDKIVTGVRGTLLPTGGSMQIRLDPPELGAIQIAITMRDGVMSASFETNNDDATRLLSHSLGQLKTALENSGVVIDKLHVQQSPKNEHASNSDDSSQQQNQAQDSPARREQERRELLRRMWRRLSEGSDPLDLVA